MPAAAFLNQFPVNPADPLLSDLQGNILKGHGRPFTFNIFLSFKPNMKEEVRKWLASFSRVFVTSARKQLDETQLFHDTGIPGGLFASVFLTAAGYTYLGVPAAKTPTDPRFTAGMKASGGILQDPAPATWNTGLNGAAGVIHAMILVGDTDVHHARSFARAIKLSLGTKADVVAMERGVALRNAKGDGIEHNNYVDGISQPIFFDDERPPTTAQWDPQAKPSLMVVTDPGGDSADSLGSYFVFRKLEQNVRGFKTREKEVAKAVFHLPANEATWTPAQDAQAELIGAWAVGRFEDGTPVMMHGTATNPAPNHQENDFNYAAVGSATKCPFFAHIRKSGPRTDVSGPVFNKTKRLVRRGIPFEIAPRVRDAAGNLSDDADDQPTGGVGLLFMCYVANISNQFEFVQQTWIDSPSFAQPGTGKDPLIGQPANVTNYKWPNGYGVAATTTLPFGDFIAMRGGEYFFAPSVSMLRGLSPGLPIIVHPPKVLAPVSRITLPQLLDIHFPPVLFFNQIDSILQLFVPDRSDVGAGVVKKP